MSRKRAARNAKVSRKTKETNVQVRLNLDGSGKVLCNVDDQFLRHMVETLGRYSGADLEVSASGDIDHHIAEDVAISLGRAYRDAVGDIPIARISSATVPMDEALVQVTVDLIDRPFAHLELPDVMYEHFVRSFAMELRATVHSMVLRGKDQHHIVEATFKALGLALKGATTPSGAPLSTKSKVSWRTS
jgi:imidazoleglycerol-phosphate dehydratase